MNKPESAVQADPNILGRLTIRDVTNPNIVPPGRLFNPYGRVNAFGEPREMQLGLKFEF